ncbi:glutathione S-transferase family protein [Hyphomicrobium sp.]|uniref:glutathione S-transferase family protein n=1 Tax=Hyphomicrobium sp. TaxID=82 RepID=UPI002BA98052|nr:glutathione S-transferase family protein [Hyphomicrobium sp.]HRN87073.1 glutathione S-transferase family protein [Hyphomicrobium sp.]HRQ26391.1 glutathione S-transferase family protein [Hyphomicrobium sp.]
MARDTYRLVIGSKHWSSWSLRPWLAMKQAGLDFEEIRINLRAPNKKELILQHSPAGKVPVLWASDLLIWDSLAILEYIAERHPDAQLWPSDSDARAIARSVSAEMHSGFQALREHCPMKFLSQELRDTHIEPVEADIRRIVALWGDCRRRFGGEGPFLFSRFSVADAMYAPVASRLRTYVNDLAAFGDDGTASAYIEALYALPAMDEWKRGAEAEREEAVEGAG